MSDNCPVCKTDLSNKQPTRNAAFSTYAYDCPRCGKFVFKFSESELAMKLNYGHDDFKISILSHNIRKMQKNDSEVVLDSNLVDKILKGALPTPAEQKDIFIRWIGDNIKAGGDYVRVNEYSIQAIIGAGTLAEFHFIFEHLKSKGFVKNKTVVGGGNALMDVTLSYDGWEYYEELKKGEINKQKSLISMEPIPEEQTDETQNSSNDGKSIMEWDVFICHASEDKNDFVKPLADALKHVGLRVWYDEFSLKTGDSLRQSIDKGLSKSLYGIVIISPRFLKKDWPQKELDGLVAREGSGEKVILPIWLNIDKEMVQSYSPILAGKKAISSNYSLDQIVKQLLYDMDVKAKRKVGIDTFHGEMWGGLTNLLGNNAFDLVRINSKIDTESLKSIRALIIATKGMNSDNKFGESEIDAIHKFVNEGGILLCIDQAWSWVCKRYGNKPLEQFPLNVLGERIGFCITGKSINPPKHFSTEIMEGIGAVKKEEWAPSEIEFYGEDAQGFIMDDKDRIIAGFMPVGRGFVAVVGHRGLLTQNPDVTIRILAYFAREKQWTL